MSVSPRSNTSAASSDLFRFEASARTKLKRGDIGSCKRPTRGESDLFPRSAREPRRAPLPTPVASEVSERGLRRMAMMILVRAAMCRREPPFCAASCRPHFFPARPTADIPARGPGSVVAASAACGTRLARAAPAAETKWKCPPKRGGSFSPERRYGLPDDGAAYSIVKEKSPIVTGSAWLSMYGAAGSGHVPVPLIA